MCDFEICLKALATIAVMFCVIFQTKRETERIRKIFKQWDK